MADQILTWIAARPSKSLMRASVLSWAINCARVLWVICRRTACVSGFAVKFATAIWRNTAAWSTTRGLVSTLLTWKEWVNIFKWQWKRARAVLTMTLASWKALSWSCLSSRVRIVTRAVSSATSLPILPQYLAGHSESILMCGLSVRDGRHVQDKNEAPNDKQCFPYLYWCSLRSPPLDFSF